VPFYVIRALKRIESTEVSSIFLTQQCSNGTNRIIGSSEVKKRLIAQCMFSNVFLEKRAITRIKVVQHYHVNVLGKLNLLEQGLI
jgi:hypothetical protein